MFCPTCGTENTTGASFCPNCGTALNAAPQQSNPYAKSNPYQSYEQQSYEHQSYKPHTPSHYEEPSIPVASKVLGGIGMGFGIFAMIFMCLLGWFGLFFGITGVVLSGIANGQANNVGRSNGMAKAGLTTSIIAIVFSFMSIVALADYANSWYAWYLYEIL